MLAAELSLLSEPIDGVEQRAEELRAFLPTTNIDKLVEVRRLSFCVCMCVCALVYMHVCYLQQ
jgi:hypothetical protein